MSKLIKTLKYLWRIIRWVIIELLFVLTIFYIGTFILFNLEFLFQFFFFLKNWNLFGFEIATEKITHFWRPTKIVFFVGGWSIIIVHFFEILYYKYKDYKTKKKNKW